ncbi:MAG: TonB family protein [Deltaproteobacteria bacterium]|nr:TonB family protein [Deltaproteobacteria bacterium]
MKAEYPPKALEESREGVVFLHMTITKEGKVTDVKIVKSAGKDFDEAALKAVKQFVFKPATVNGNPVPAKVPLRYPFKLSGKGTSSDSQEKSKSEQKKNKEVKLIEEKGENKEQQGKSSDKKIENKKSDGSNKKEENKNQKGDSTPTAIKSRATEDATPAAKINSKKVQATIEGVIFQKGSSSKIGDANILIYQKVGKNSFGALVKTEFSKSNGLFQIKLPAGDYWLLIKAPGCYDYKTSEALALGENLKVQYFVERKIEDPYATIIRGKAVRKEVTRYSIALPEIISIPGTQGDALRSIQNMPGVARSTFNLGFLIVRGAAPEDTRVFFEGHEIPQLYHFLGLTSVFNSDLLKKIDFMPGNFSARYGRAMGGIIDVFSRKPKSDALHGYLDMDLWDTSLLVEGPLPKLKKGSFAISLRRSYIDSVLAAAPDSLVDIQVFPVYYDYQFMVNYPIFKGDLRFIFFGSDDRINFEETNEQPYSSNFQKAILLWQRKWGKNNLKASVAVDSNKLQLKISDNRFRFGYEYNNAAWRLDYTRKLSDKLKLSWGLDGTVTDFNFNIAFRNTVGGEDNEDPDDPFSNISETVSDIFFHQAVYLEAIWNPIKKLTVIPGLRADFLDKADSFQDYALDPRLTVKYELMKDKLELKTGIGMYHQDPDTRFLYRKGFGNPNLTWQDALHTTAGFKWQINRSTTLEIAGFYKYLWDLVANSDNTVMVDGKEVPIYKENTGIGRVYGAEVLLKKKNSLNCPKILGIKKCFGWLSYTIMRSERKENEEDPYELFSFDQTHIMTAIFSVKWPGGWQAGFRFRLASGNPYTPTIGGIYDADTDNYIGVSGDSLSKRLPMFHQLDFRVDKKFTFNRWSLTLYLDLQNLYNNQVTEFMVYNYNYTKTTTLNGLPIFPSFGIKGAF